MSIADELLALKSGDGLIIPAKVVDWAQAHPDSELHSRFNWDVQDAAYQYWCWQARCLISLHIVGEHGERQTISLMFDRTNGGGYRDLGEVMNTKQLRQQAVIEAVVELQRFCDRHKYLAELKPVFAALERVIAKEHYLLPDTKRQPRGTALAKEEARRG